MIQEQPWKSKTIIITLSRDKANNGNLWNEPLGTSKPHTSIFFHPVLTVALCAPHLVWRNWGMAGMQACVWLEWHPDWSPETLTSDRASGCPLRSHGVHTWLKINWSRGCQHRNPVSLLGSFILFDFLRQGLRLSPKLLWNALSNSS